MKGSESDHRHLRAVEPASSTVLPAGEKLQPAGEAELLALARRGDHLAWSRLYELHFDVLYRHLGRMVSNPAIAEDLAQDTFVVAFRRLAHFDGRSKLSTWLHGIGVNLVRDHFRKEHRRRRAYGLVEGGAPASASPGACPALSHERSSRAKALLAAVEALPPRLREAFVLFELRQLDRSEVAELLETSAGAVSIRVSRARRRIRAQLKRAGWLEEEAPP